MIRALKAQFFPKGVRPFLTYHKNALFRRVSRKRIVDDLRALGIGPGDFLCVHSAMSRCGHVSGGAMTFVTSLQEIVGREGTLMVPTFTGGNSTLSYVKTNPAPFDAGSTGCTTGRINEVFRQLPGAVRSHHPTHSVSAWGRLAYAIVKDHHLSPTPFGNATPYAKLIEHRGKVVLINVNANSLVHHIQELVDWPGNYLDQAYSLPVNLGDRLVDVSTKVHAPGSGCIRLPGTGPDVTVKLQIPDYALPFCLNKKTREDFEKIDNNVKSEIEDRCRFFRENGIVTIGPVGYGQAAVIGAGEFSNRLRQDLLSHLEKCREDHN